MTELSFSRSFLATLGARPQRLGPDHVEDPRKLPARNPYTLPRTLPEYRKKRKLDAAPTPGSTPALNLTIKPLRPSPGVPPVTLPDTPLTTTVYSLKAKYAEKTGNPAEKVKLLVKGKPLADTKTLEEAGFAAGGEGTVTVMVMGGGVVKADTPPAETKEVEMGDAAKPKVLETAEFWDQLKAFVAGKLEGQEDAEKVVGVWRRAWEAQKA